MKLMQLLLCASLLAGGSPSVVLASQGPGNDQTPPDSAETMHATSGPAEPVLATPLVMQIVRRPIPFKGGDGHYHLVYELQLENYTGDLVSADQLQVLDSGSGRAVAELNAAKIASHLMVRDARAVPGSSMLRN
jgi:hypothetical protein